MLSPLLFKLVGVAILLGGVFLSGYNTAKKFDTAALAKANAEAQEKYEAKDVAYNQIASQLLDAQHANAARTKIITQRVTQVVQHPIYRNVCLDPDGLSVANDALTRKSTTPAQPDATLPPADTAK